MNKKLVRMATHQIEKRLYPNLRDESGECEEMARAIIAIVGEECVKVATTRRKQLRDPVGVSVANSVAAEIRALTQENPSPDHRHADTGDPGPVEPKPSSCNG
jgi:hypothetical protein